MTPIATSSPTDRRGCAIDRLHDITHASAPDGGRTTPGTRALEADRQLCRTTEVGDRFLAPFDDHDGALGAPLPEAEARDLGAKARAEQAIEVGVEQRPPRRLVLADEGEGR